MKARINPSNPMGYIKAPPSKSAMQRAVAASLLAKGESVLYNPSFSDDSLAAINMAEKLGASITKYDDKVVIKGGLNPSFDALYCGESGLGVRMFSPIVALFDKPISINGLGTLLNRPMQMIKSTLSQLGAQVVTNNGKLPISIKGPMIGGKAIVDGSLSSQLLTGLLMALPMLDNETILQVSNLKSRPYIDLTLEILKHFGVDVINNDYKEFIINGKQEYKPCTYIVEEDWSGAAFLLVAGALGNGVCIKNVSQNSLQADKEILNILEQVGADVNWKGTEVSVSRNTLKSFKADLSNCPDLAPPLVCLASFCNGRSILTGTSRLADKESDRALTLRDEFNKMGAKVNIQEDKIEIFGSALTGGVSCKSHRDHRIAMALSIAASFAKKAVTIDDVESVNKSYPNFFEDIESLGVNVEYLNL